MLGSASGGAASESGELSWRAAAMLAMCSATGTSVDRTGADVATRACWYQSKRLVLACGGGVGCGCSSMSCCGWTLWVKRPRESLC